MYWPWVISTFELSTAKIKSSWYHDFTLHLLWEFKNTYIITFAVIKVHLSACSLILLCIIVGCMFQKSVNTAHGRVLPFKLRKFPTQFKEWTFPSSGTRTALLPRVSPMNHISLHLSPYTRLFSLLRQPREEKRGKHAPRGLYRNRTSLINRKPSVASTHHQTVPMIVWTSTVSTMTDQRWCQMVMRTWKMRRCKTTGERERGGGRGEGERGGGRERKKVLLQSK